MSEDFSIKLRKEFTFNRKNPLEIKLEEKLNSIFLFKCGAERDATYVADKYIPIKESRKELTAAELEEIKKNEYKIGAQRLMKKYKGIWRNSNLDEKCFVKLFELVDRLHLKVDKFDSQNFNTPEEQIVDRILILFANEAGMNSKTVSHDTPPYGGLFQLANNTVKGMKQWAKEHPELFPNGLNTNFTTAAEFARNVKPEEQIEWLVAYVGCKGHLDEEKTVDRLAQVIKTGTLAHVTRVLDRTAEKNKVPKGTKYLNA